MQGFGLGYSGLTHRDGSVTGLPMEWRKVPPLRFQLLDEPRLTSSTTWGSAWLRLRLRSTLA